MGIRSKLLGSSLVLIAITFAALDAYLVQPLAGSAAELFNARVLLGLSAALVAAITSGISITAAHLMGRSIRGLTPVARAMSDGNFSLRAPVMGDDEVADLSRALNRLAADLEASWGAVRSERDLLDAVFEGMDEGVLVVDKAGHIARTNATLRSWLGLSAEPAGRTPIEIWRDAQLDQAISAALGRAEIGRLDLTISGPRGRPVGSRALVKTSQAATRQRLLLGRVAPLSPIAGGGAVAVFHDVTELRRLERVRRDFVANVSHELRTPISAIQGAAETILEGGIDDPADTQRFIGVIGRHATRLGALLSDLLELSRLESRAEPLDASEIDLAESAREALGQLSERIASKKLRAELSLPEGLPPAAGDRRASARILGNLLENAINHTEPGGSICLRGAAEEAHVWLEVADTGIGIEAHHLPRIFERFYRADAGRSRTQGGTGLGLSIVKHLVQAMGGEVSVESTPGKGSAFRVRLRRA